MSVRTALLAGIITVALAVGLGLVMADSRDPALPL